MTIANVLMQKLKENVTIFGTEKVRIMRIKNVMINLKVTELIKTITSFSTKKGIFQSEESNPEEIKLELDQEVNEGDAGGENDFEAEMEAL